MWAGYKQTKQTNVATKIDRVIKKTTVNITRISEVSHCMKMSVELPFKSAFSGLKADTHNIRILQSTRLGISAK